MLSSRRICPFGLPDEAEDVENVVLAAVGHTFRAATAPMLDTPLPAELAGLLRRIDRQERNAQARGRAALPRRRRVKLGDRPSPAPHIPSRPTAGPTPALTVT
jgi:hypothetical protein